MMPLGQRLLGTDNIIGGINLSNDANLCSADLNLVRAHCSKNELKRSSTNKLKCQEHMDTLFFFFFLISVSNPTLGAKLLGETDQVISIYNTMRKLLAIPDRILKKSAPYTQQGRFDSCSSQPPIEHLLYNPDPSFESYTVSHILRYLSS